MTGLNDIKECFLFAQPVSCNWLRFGENLTGLLSSVCEVAGCAGCALLVPGHPIEATPRFNQFWPLSAAVRGVTHLWEEQKRLSTEAAQAHETARVAAEGGRGAHPREAHVRFLQPSSQMVAQLMDGADYFAADGMHPNDQGYALWADLIATRLLTDLRE